MSSTEQPERAAIKERVENKMSARRSSLVRGAAVWVALALLLALISNQVTSCEADASKQESLNRKSIVFDLKTPRVFYCPQEKPADMDKMIVKAQPLDRLCQFGGRPKPKNEPSDCYNDVDESEFACDEKKRFLVSRRLGGASCLKSNPIKLIER